jgi:hypothetical protein
MPSVSLDVRASYSSSDDSYSVNPSCIDVCKTTLTECFPEEEESFSARKVREASFHCTKVTAELGIPISVAAVAAVISPQLSLLNDPTTPVRVIVDLNDTIGDFCDVGFALGAILYEGCAVGLTVGTSVGAMVGAAVGDTVGIAVGVAVVGLAVGTRVGIAVGATDGVIVGRAEGVAVLGLAVGV